MQYHPDKNNSEDAQKMFLIIDHAYNYLYHGKIQSPARRKPTSTTTDKKWENVHHPPKNSAEFESWRKAKEEYSKERSEATKQKERARFEKQKNQLHNSPLFYPIYGLYYFVCMMLLTTGFFLCLLGIIYGAYTGNPFLFIIIFAVLSFFGVATIMTVIHIRAEVGKYFKSTN